MRTSRRNGSAAAPDAVRLRVRRKDGPNAPLVLSAVVALAIPIVGLVAGPGLATAAIPVVVMAYTLLFLAYPTLAVCLYVASRPIVDTFIYSDPSLFGGRFSLGQAWGAGLIVLLVAYLAQATFTLWSKYMDWRLAFYLSPVLFLAVYGVLTVLRPGEHFAFVAGSRLAAWVLLAYVFERASASERGQRLVVLAGQATAVLLVFAVGVAIVQNRYGAAYYGNRNEQFLIGHANAGEAGAPENLQAPFVYSSLAVLCVPFVAAAFVGRRPTRWQILLVGLLTAAVILSYVRSTYLALAIVAVPSAVVGLRRASRRSRAGVLVAAAAALLVTGVALGGRIVDRFTHGSGRFDLWRADLSATLHGGHTIVIGGGAAFTRRVWELRTGIPGGDWAHNDFLEVFATGGLILLVLYLLVLAWMLQAVWAVRRDPRQSDRARAFALIALGAFFAFVGLSFVSGVVFSVPSLLMGSLVGLLRGMARTPGETLLDVAAHDQPAGERPVVAGGARAEARR